MLNTQGRDIFESEHEQFRDSVRKFFDVELTPNLEKWEEEGLVDKNFWLACGEASLLCPGVPEAYGGLGLGYRYNAVIGEELAYAGSSAGITLQSDIVADYIINYGSEEQKRHWLPRMVTGETITAIAMTEPGAGSDLQGVKTTARRDGNHYVINGSKTYITNGQNADLVIVVAKTDPNAGSKGISLILVESECEGFARGRNLDKIGQHSADTSELFFNDVRVPLTNCLGEEGKGFVYLMSQLPQERLSIAVGAQASAQKAFDDTVAFTKDRKAFAGVVFDFQNTRFVLAQAQSDLLAARALVDAAIAAQLRRELDPARAALVKAWCSDLASRLTDACLQLFGGYGYLQDYPIERFWRDLRVHSILEGTNQVMRMIVSRELLRQ